MGALHGTVLAGNQYGMSETIEWRQDTAGRYVLFRTCSRPADGHREFGGRGGGHPDRAGQADLGRARRLLLRQGAVHLIG